MRTARITEGPTAMMKLMLTFRNFANAPKIYSRQCRGTKLGPGQSSREVCYSFTAVGVYGRALDRIFYCKAAILNTGFRGITRSFQTDAEMDWVNIAPFQIISNHHSPVFLPLMVYSFKWSAVKTGARKQTSLTYRQSEVLELVLLKETKVAVSVLNKETEVAELILCKEYEVAGLILCKESEVAGLVQVKKLKWNV